MKARTMASAGLSLWLAGCGTGAEELPALEETGTGEAAQALVACPRVSGSFTASGNSLYDLDANLASRNPIVKVVASGNTLTFVARNGESGTLTLTGATASGTFVDPTPYNPSWLNGLRSVYAPNSASVRIDGDWSSSYITLSGATAQASFMFLDPIFASSSYAYSVTGSGNTISFTDVWGATGTLTLNGPANCTP